MDLGFETIGNATLICHDHGPLLVTDPWLGGPAYFGSWGLTHEIPPRQMEAILAARFVWLSHGHPDHLSPDSLERLRGKPILLGDHYGGRIAAGLREAGHEVRILETGRWTPLSDRVRVLCVPDYGQDSVLFLDVDGTLVIDANDAGDRGVGPLLRELTARHERSFLLWLTGHGDADMINVFDEDGRRIPPPGADKAPLGPVIAQILEHYGIKNFVPFSSMHKYERADSVWANEYRTDPHEHALGFESKAAEMLPAFVRFDLAADRFETIDPPVRPEVALPSEDFGDDWSEELVPGEADEVAAYFRRFEHLRSFLGFLNFRVGGKDNVIDVERSRFDRGITFDVPRGSLMTCVRYGIFDDLLIGNYMKTTMHGPWERTGTGALYPDFNPFVTKYGDNGGCFTRAQLADYFAFYRAKGSFGAGPSPASARDLEAARAYLAD